MYSYSNCNQRQKGRDDAEKAAVWESKVVIEKEKDEQKDLEGKPAHPFASLFKSNLGPSNLFIDSSNIFSQKKQSKDRSMVLKEPQNIWQQHPPVPYKEYLQLKQKYQSLNRQFSAAIRYANKQIIRGHDQADKLRGCLVDIVKQEKLIGGGIKNHRLFTIENQKHWEQIYGWAQKITNHIKQLCMLLPDRQSQLGELLLNLEEEIVQMVKKLLGELPHKIDQIVREEEQEKRKQLSYLQKVKSNLEEVMEQQKEEFTRAQITFCDATAEMTLQPWKNQIQKLQNKRNQLKIFGEKNDFFAREDSFMLVFKDLYSDKQKKAEREEQEKKGEEKGKGEEKKEEGENKKVEVKKMQQEKKQLLKQAYKFKSDNIFA